ncbi:MAG: immune inhibitor A [Methanomassiliicoccales archaeon]|nr:immune inhibitor A [Methanomassiliicoccales archaeon]
MPNNATKVISIAIVLTMVVGAFAVIMSGGSAVTTSTKSVAVADPFPMDIDPQVKKQQVNIGSAYESGLMTQVTYAPGDYYDVGSIVRFYVGGYGKWAYNETNPSNLMLFEKRTERQNVEVWVATDLLFWPGDPRNDGRVVITDPQANYIADQFNDTIYPIMTANFGAPPPLTGDNSIMPLLGYPYFQTNVSGRVMLMIFNIYDTSFVNPTYPSYVAGYFSPSMDYYYDRNIIHIDCWDWVNRTTEFVPRPFVYESTVAHEYQHLLNNYHNPDQASFLNEGCSMYAEMLCGYGVPWDHIEWFLATPDNSLTEWGDQGDINILADYGAAALYVIWLHDHFGPDFVIQLVNSTYGEEVLSGIADVNAAFEAFGLPKWDFDRSFNSWRLANLIHGDSPGNGLYDYTSLDIGLAGGPLINNYDPWATYAQSGSAWVESAAWEFGPSVTLDGTILPSGDVNSYGTDYIHVTPSDPINFNWLKFGFAGDTVVKKGWQTINMPVSTGDVLFFEDFNHGGSLGDWYTQSMGPVYGHPWQAWPYLSNPSDYFAVASSDAAGGGINEIMFSDISIDTTGYDHLQLSFDSDFQRYGSYIDVGYVLYSVDGGDTYKILANFNQDQLLMTSAYPMASGHVVVNLNADDLAGFSSVLLAFYYSAEGWDWYWAVDNIELAQVYTTPVWWSDRGDLVDYSLRGTVDLTAYSEEDTITLGLDTKWNLEEDWDFGFVQVSEDGGVTWESLENDYTTFDAVPEALPLILENLPGITGQNPSWGNSGWASLDHLEFDLSDYAGESIMLQFRELTDWSTNYDGWYIKNVTVNDVVIDNAADIIGFEPIPAYEDESWFVSIYATTHGATSYDGVYYLPVVLNLNIGDTGEVQKALDSLSVYTDFYIIVSPEIGPADYGFGMFNEFPLPI